jgi:hypothetical protein
MLYRQGITPCGLLQEGYNLLSLSKNRATHIQE